jgi:hypothetical protein
MGRKHGGEHPHGKPSYQTPQSVIERNEGNSEKKPSKWWGKSDWVTALSSAVLAVFAFASFLLLWKQLNDAREALGVDQRPWVTIVPAWPEEKMANGTMAQKVIIDTGQRLEVPIKISNTGKTPALRISYTVSIEIVEQDKSPLLENPINPPWSVIGGTLFPNAPETNFVYRRKPSKSGEMIFNDLTATEKESISSGDSYLAVYGEISYWDGFGIPHWTRFCAPVVFAKKSGLYNYRPCTEYNNVDTNR